ncbi:PREDICTED: uncharacterized protein LOC107327886 isoform X2 [Acropora digitifera]|uniref:uncharacterized protein LOC107327886 isoform X2 n=1 Tax=Acropora digitifera TaxID=70779 RepID=UPI00077ADCD4|nr:PREDICTED: uncharacterized protein LOC107327886 isoform X2 [Acropora digitifera]
MNICEEYPEAIAIETEGEGVYAAAYDANIDWVIVKGVASYFHQSKPATSEWMSFASAMAASVVAKMLNDPAVFLEWPHCNQENHGKRPIHPLGTTTPKRERQNAAFPKTDRDISDVVELLKKEYNRRADFSPLLWSKGMKLQLKEVYTRLRVVFRRKARSSEIDVDDIFGSSEEDNDPLVLVEGSPGIGKTTFCLKLAHDWANGAMPRNFPTFKLVFLVKCRDMKGDVIENIVEDIFEQLLPEDLKEETKEALVNFFEELNNQKQILIILDGLDELPDKSEDRVNKVLGRKKLSFCYVLATTRQEEGIETRKQFKFDMCLAIEGFSKDDSFEYIRKHFRNIGSSTGERLIKEVKQNPLLRDLQRNPLNLLLLCVVYEDHEGSLPSSITDLYQTIVRCLLRRYCAREELKAPEKDEDLDKQFEIPILALAELAWKCLLNDHLSFYEDELEVLERSNENIVARRLGLVYKEESLKRLKPRHAYCFLHKTFQEYLAASHIAHKFRRSEFQMLDQMLFPEIARSKFKQVFVFVCGILREEANIVFEQIGLNLLQKQWDWLKCDMSTAIFFLDIWKETGNAERMAKTLWSFLPFPRPLHLWSREQCMVLSYVLKECAKFSEELTVAAPEVHVSPRIASSILHLFKNHPDSTSFIFYGVSLCGEEYEHLKRSVGEKLTFALFADVGEGVSKLPGFGFSSVRLRICGSLGSSSLQDFENLLLHKCLCTLSITVYGDVQESLVEALARGLARESAVKFLDLCVNGNFSFRGAYFLEQGILRNRSLTNVKVSVNGEPPENWQAVAKNVCAQFAEKKIVSEIYPNTFSKVKDSQVTHLNRFLSKFDLKQQTVALNVWGELSGDGCKAVCEVLLHTPVSQLTLNIHGQLTDEMLRYIARCVEEHEEPSPVTINAWVELTKKENKLIKELGVDKNPLFSLNVRGTSAPLKESSDSTVFPSDEPQSLIALFEKATKDPSKFTEDKWLTLEIDCYDEDSGEWGGVFDEGISRNISLESLTIKIKDRFTNHELEYGLGEGLAGNTSLKWLTLEIDCYDEDSGEWGGVFDEGISRNISLESLTIKIKTKRRFVSSKWEHGLGEGLAGNTSLKSLTLEIDYYYDGDDKWERGLDEGLARNTPLELLTLPINNGEDRSNQWGHIFAESLAKNNSLNSLTLTINNYGYMSDEWGFGLAEGLARNTSLKSITFTLNNYLYVSSVWRLGLFEGSARNTSLTSITLSINNYGTMKGERRHDIIEGLARNASLTSITLAINNYADMTGEWRHCLFEGLARNTSLNSLTLTANNYGDMNEEWGCALRESLRKRGALTDCNLIVDICGNC